MNYFSQSNKRFILFSVLSMFSAAVISNQVFAGSDDENEPMDIVHIRRSKKRKDLELKIPAQPTKRSKTELASTTPKDLQDYRLQAARRHLDNLKAAISGGHQTIENKLAVSALKEAQKIKLLSRLQTLPMEIKYLTLVLSLPNNECVDKRHRQLTVRDRKTFKALTNLPLQTQLKTYLQANGKGLLEIIDLSDSKVTNEDIAWIAPHFPNLTSLDLWNTRVTDAGLQHVAGLNNLTKLNLWGTLVTDVGLQHVAGLNSLTTLNLGDTRVTDAGLQHVAGLNSLTLLDLKGTSVTNAGLAHVAGLNRLTSLSFMGY